MAHKIQIKRGNKADLPTLDVGEFGLCQDTNELFIGNSGNQKIFPPTAPTISNVEGLQTALDNKVDNSQVLTNVPVNAKFTDTTYAEITTTEIDNGTASTPRTITGRRIEYILDKVSGWLGDKVDKVSGKGLSTNDYTTTEKNKLDSIEANANNYVHPGSGTNPHGTVKSDIGLSDVENYGIATQAEAEAGTSNTRYTTPLRVKQAINNHNTDVAAHDDIRESINSLDALFVTNADAKNSIYRGKYLGTTVTAAQYTAISSGTFTDLYIGDYWTIGGVNWRIAAFNYYRNTGDSSVLGNHITIVPDTQLYGHVMNDTNITTGGYTGSKMYTEGLEQAKTTIRGIFGTHLVKHRQILSNATVDGKASGWAWVDSEVDLMSEIMVYGSVVWGESTIGGSAYNIGVGKSQLPLFALNPRMINTRQSYWLRDVVSAAYFACVYESGLADRDNASGAYGVRPDFSIS